MKYSYFPKGILFFLSVLCTIPCFGQVLSVNPQDSLVVLEFHNRLQAEGWPSQWDDTTPARQWNGIFWEPLANGRVTGVSLIGNGSFTAESMPLAITVLKDLDELEELYINSFGLERVTSEIGELTQLKVLHLSDNELSVLPPEINNLGNLELLIMDRNRFTSLPNLSGLTNLNTLSLTQNYDLEEVALDNLVSLEILRLDFCPITELPETIGQLTNLRVLNVNQCKLSSLPDAMANLTSLQELHMLRNEFNTLPPVVGSIRSLLLLDVAFNKLAELPTELGQLENLVDIRFNHNLFTVFPSSILDLPALRGINGSNNQITGNIPSRLFTVANTLIDLSDNHLSGEILLGPGGQVPQRLHIPGNRFELKDIHALYPALALAGTDLEFNPQRLIGSNTIMIPEAGTDIVITVDDYTPLAGAQMNWYRSNSVNGKLSADFLGQGNSWTLNDFDPSTDGGVFFCKVTHPDLPGLELESEEIRVIGTNDAPLLFAEDLKFRKDNIPLFTFNATDDYTNGQDLVWDISGSTRFSFSELPFIGVERREIILTDPGWSGSELVELRVTDEQGNTTTETVTITVLEETNAPPEIGTMPPIYLNFDFSLPNIGATTCPETFYFSAIALLNPFVSDDFDDMEDLTIRIHPNNPDELLTYDLSVNIGDGGPRKDINALSTSCGNTFFSVTFTLEVEDREGGSSSREVVIINDPANTSPQVLPIPEQVIIKGGTDFPRLDLTSYVSDDNLQLDQLEFSVISQSDIAVEFEKEDGTVMVNASPINLDSSYTDTVRILVHESTNPQFNTEFTITYRILENGILVSGTILKEDATPIAGVELTGFERPVSTNNQGFYTVEVTPGWTGIVVPVLTGYTFSPENMALSNLQNVADGIDFIGIPLIERYTISGRIVDETGNPLPNVLLGGFTDTISTDANGVFVASEEAGWTGTVIPKLQGYTFSPKSITITDLQADRASIDFTAVANPMEFSISGRVLDVMGNPVPNVVMNGFSSIVSTRSDGTYTVTQTIGWSGSISPELDGYTFSPENIMIADLQTDLASVDFMAVVNPMEFSISGTVMDIMGNPVPNVVINGFSGMVSTDGDGNYRTNETDGWSSTLFPELQGYTFVPERIAIPDLASDRTDIDFTAMAIPIEFAISGTVTDQEGNPMESVLLKGFTKDVISDMDGHFGTTESMGWSGVITPELEGHRFEPTTVGIDGLDKDCIVDFMAIPDSLDNVKMLIYPNPGKDGEFTVLLPQPEPIRSIRIFGSSGRLLHESRVEGTFDSYTVEHALPTGLYTLEVRTGKDRIAQNLLVR